MEQSNGTNGTNGTNGHNGHMAGKEKPRYLNFPALKHPTFIDGKQALNRWSSTITKGENSSLDENSELTY